MAVAVSFPIVLLAAVDLVEFARNNRWTDLIEVNLSNLAEVPSIMSVLLALAVLLGFIGLPRSSPPSGGIAPALMTFSTIIASRAALRAVPPLIMMNGCTVFVRTPFERRS